ncbi:hypothetical protein [Pseudooceanicola sp. LIPI14-2-Ac024]|uniref:hypothetical protein n=1 Tax=Pseudooceanicola sp. LIPI14-2-Ac024 TaxID=3344875 RepID=UPI0035CFC23A
MRDEIPRVTTTFFTVMVIAHDVRKKALINEGALSKLTVTSKAYWEELRMTGRGPRYCEDLGQVWYRLADVQDWLEENIFKDREVRHD